MKMQAAGSFEVKMTPLGANDGPAEKIESLGRFLIDKQIHGDLEATTKGQMLACGDGRPGSSGVYVALERVTGSLHGRKGSFSLYHVGVMNKGEAELRICVVPGSGTDELKGLAGEMTINRPEAGHTYELNYTLATL